MRVRKKKALRLPKREPINGRLDLLRIPVCPPSTSPHLHWGKECECPSPGKAALESNWNGKALKRYENGADRDAHNQKIAAHVEAGGNVGWVVPPGVVVLDADTEEAAAWVERCCPNAPRQQTSRGAHFVFKIPADLRLTNRAELAPDVTVDVKGSGSMIVCEPSVHVSGVKYRWTRSLPQDLDDLPELPVKLLEKIRSKRDNKKPAGPAVSPGLIPEGGRHAAVRSHTARLLNAGLEGEELWTALETFNSRRCRPPLPDSEIRDLFEWFTNLPPEGLNPKQGTTALAEQLRVTGNLKRGEAGHLWRHDSGAYRLGGEAWVADWVKDVYGVHCRSFHVHEVVKYLQAGTIELTPEMCAHTGFINTSNGLLDWRTGELRPHDPAVPSMNQIPVAWNPDAKASETLKFLREVYDGDEELIQLDLEIVGQGLRNQNLHRTAVLLQGGGANGKSTRLGQLVALLGPENVSAVPLQKLAEDRFAVAELYGKLANLCGDLDTRGIHRTDTFKMLTGGDRVMAERKYQPAWSFQWNGLMVFAANSYPVARDPSEAWWDRWTVLPFSRRFTGKKADPHKLARLTQPEELEGLLVLAVEALRGVEERGGFTRARASRRALATYRKAADSVLAFLAEDCLIAKTEAEARALSIPTRALYSAYTEACRDQGRSAVGANTFYVRAHDLATGQLGGVVRRAKRRGVRTFRGLALHTDREAAGKLAAIRQGVRRG